MGKIKKTASARHSTTLSPAVAEFIKSCTRIPLHYLPSLLDEFPKRWNFPRGDLYHWIEPLNRFDVILEKFIDLYALNDGPQTRPFGRELLLNGDGVGSGMPLTATDSQLDDRGLPYDADRELVEKVLLFTKLLFENCGNRALYASSERITGLLNTVSLTLLEATLRLGHRLTQRFAAQKWRTDPNDRVGLNQALIDSYYKVSLDKVEVTSKPFSSCARLVTQSKDERKASAISVSDPDFLSLFQGLHLDDLFETLRTTAKTLDEAPGQLPSAGDTSTPGSPTLARRASAGAVKKNNKADPTSPVDEAAGLRKSSHADMRVSIWDSIPAEEKDLPALMKTLLPRVHPDRHLALLHWLRVSQALKASEESRHRILTIRLLGLLNMAHVYYERDFLEYALDHEPDEPRRFTLPYQLCDLLHPPGNAVVVTTDIQTLALANFEALATNKIKPTDVVAAANVNVNHGMVAYLVRKAVSDLSVEESAESELVNIQWKEGLFALLHGLPRAKNTVSEGFVSAGIIDMMVEALTYRTSKAENDFARVLNFLDICSYNHKEAFPTLVNAKGLDAISELLSHEVELASSLAKSGSSMPVLFKTAMTDYDIPFQQQHILRTLFKFVNNIMSYNSGQFDRLLRNLIESSQLLKGLRSVIVSPTLYGSNVWSGSVGLFSNFVNNEPTSYAAINEAGIPTAFIQTVTPAKTANGPESNLDTLNAEGMPSNDGGDLTAIEPAEGILPAAESILAIPHAFGAMCLNESGKKQFADSNAMQHFFSIFESRRHIQAMLLNQNFDVEGLGTVFDELSRHHPSLKPPIIDCIYKLVRSTRAKARGNDALGSSNTDSVTAEHRLGEDTEMQDAPQMSTDEAQAQAQAAPLLGVQMAENTPLRASNKLIPLPDLIMVVARFLNGFFMNTNLITPLAEKPDAIELILDIAMTPAISQTFGGQAWSRMCRVINTLIESKPHLTLPSLITRVQELLDSMSEFLDDIPRSSIFWPILSNPQEGSQNPETKSILIMTSHRVARSLVVVQSLCAILTKGLTISNNRAASNPLSSINITDVLSRLITTLGKLQSRCIWEAHLLERVSMSKDDGTQQPGSSTGINGTGNASGHQSTNGLRTQEGADQTHSAPSPPGQSGQPSPNAGPPSDSKPDKRHKSTEEKIYVCLQHLLNNTPYTIGTLFNTIAKSMFSRRISSDPYQRQCINTIMERIASALVESLQLKLPEGSDWKAMSYYRSAVISTATQAMIDRKTDPVERSGPQTLSLVVQYFNEKGGISTIGTHLISFFEIAQARTDQDPDASANSTNNAQKKVALKGIDNSLQLFSQLVNHKSVQNSQQTQALASRERDRSKPDFFSANQFQVELRYRVARAVIPLWTSSDIEKLETDNIRHLTGILNHILEGHEETNAFKRSDHSPKKETPVRRYWKPRGTDALSRLEQKGYSTDLSREALYRCSDNYSPAQEYCHRYHENPSLARFPIPAEDIPPSQETSAPNEAIASGSNLDSQDSHDRNDSGSFLLQEGPANIHLEAARLLAPLSETFNNPVASASVPDSNPIPETGPEEQLDDPMQVAQTSKAITLDDLDDERVEIRSELMARVLDILNAYPKLVFEMSELVIASPMKAPEPQTERGDIASTLVQTLISMQDALKVMQTRAKEITARAHLLGIILQESHFFEAAQDELQGSFPELLGFLNLPQSDQQGRPTWIAQVLLIIERVLAEDAQPQHIQWNAPKGDHTEKQPPLAPPVYMVPTDIREQLFSKIVDMLPKIGKDEVLALAVIRVVVILTRDHRLASKLGERKNMQGLFVMVKQLAGVMSSRLRGAFMMVLRHIIEDEFTIRQSIRKEIQAFFEKNRHVDTSLYTRTLSHIIVRAPEIFVEITNEMVDIPKYERGPISQSLSLKRLEHTADDTKMKEETLTEQQDTASEPREVAHQQPIKEGAESADKQKAELKAPVVENPDGVIHYLLSELLNYKELEDSTFDSKGVEKNLAQQDQDVVMGSSEPTSEGTTPITRAAEPRSDSGNSKKEIEFKAEDHPFYIYRCFLLQCLTELLNCYNKTKIEFINFSRKTESQISTPSKPSSSVLKYMLNVLIPTGFVQHYDECWTEQTDLLLKKKRSSTSNAAIMTIVSLCAKTAEKAKSRRQESDDGDEDPELLFVRRFVLEHALRAYKEASMGSEAFEVRYSKMLALADLFNRMLAGRPNHSSSSRQHLEQSEDNLIPSQKQLARAMYEKGFISALTSSISDIDLKTPGADRVVKYILRPVKLLTHTAVELSISSDAPAQPGHPADEEISSASSVSETDGQREETPDLFRNSTLGMFEPGREEDESSHSSDDEEDEDMYEGEYADDMDYDEEVVPDDDVVSDEDEEMDGIGHVEGLPGDIPMDVELPFDDHTMDEESGDEEEDSDIDDDAEDDLEGEEDEIEVLEEITGDEENASFSEGDEGDWQDEDEEHGEISFEDNVRGHGTDSPVGRLLIGHEFDEFTADPMADSDVVPVLDSGFGHDIGIEVDEEDVDDPESDAEGDEDDEEVDPEDDLMFGETGMEDDDAELPPFVVNIPPPGAHRMRGSAAAARLARSDYLSSMPSADRAWVSHRSFHRPSSLPRGEDNMNPLLDRGHRSDHPPPPPPGMSHPPTLRSNMPIPNLYDMPLPPDIPLGPGDNPLPYLNNLLNLLSTGGPPFTNLTDHLQRHSAHGGLHLTISPPLGPSGRLSSQYAEHMAGANHGHSLHGSRNSHEDPFSAVYFTPQVTMDRWREEANLTFGASVNEKAARVINSILEQLVPRALEAEKVRKEQERLEEERRKKEAEAERIRREAEQAEKAEQERKEREEAEARRLAEAAAQVQAVAENTEEQSAERATAEDAMEGIESTEPPDDSEPPQEPIERIYTTIRGRQLDITDLGIDAAYLEALPEDIREEVVMTQVAEQRSRAADAGEEPSTINEEFLNALPPDIRDELMQQEAAERRRRERERQRREAATSGNGPGGEEMDPASFVASLEDPNLRASILADVDEETLAQFPPDVVAEARALGGHHRRRAIDPVRVVADIEPHGFDSQNRRGLPFGHRSSEKVPRRPIVQMLDKAAVATLLRLMFVTMPANSRLNLNGILRNASGNHQTRAEIVTGLLSILQDGTTDSGAVEKSFNHLTTRARQQPAAKTPQPLKRTQSSQTVAPLDLPDASPLTVISHCLAALVFLTKSITHVPKFFLTEHEGFGSLKSKGSRKGKAKESKASRYPINALLSLLDRDSVVNNSLIMEQLAGLLESVTQPLPALLKKEKEEDKTKDTSSAEAPEAQTDATPDAVPTVTEPSGSHSQQQTEELAGVSSSMATAQDGDKVEVDSKANDTRKPLEPPEIPEANLRLIVNILAARECGRQTFGSTITVINNLSSIPTARSVFGHELVKRARELSQTIQAELAKLIDSLKDAKNEMEAQGLALASFSPADSDQVKLSRILTALDFLFDSSQQQQTPDLRKETDDFLNLLYEDRSFSAIWHRLSVCLSTTQDSGKYFLNVATILLPLIESLMVVCKRLSSRGQHPSEHSQTEVIPTTPGSEATMKEVFFSFTNKHRKILNDLVRQNPGLMKGSFSVLVKNSSVLEFDNKRKYFKSRLHDRGNGRDQRLHPHPSLQLNVRREHVFHDSYKALHFRKPDEVKFGKLNIRFHNEEGVDAGGVTREWFQVLSRKMFDPNNALFNSVAADRTTFHPNPLSVVNELHLQYFHFIGRIIGKALYENRVLDCHFSRAVYKKILGKEVNIKDMESIDLDYTKSLQWMLDNDITDIITETFCVVTNNFGATEVIDLVENGRNIPVTEENKQDYVRLMVEYRLTGSVKDQLEEFLAGFHDIVPAELVAIFDEGELELLISGMPEIDVDDWKNNSEYHNYNASSPQIQWFWRAVRSFDKEERARLLQFSTGTGKVPLNGFKELEGMNGFTKFSIHKDYGNKDRLPSSHTCFNQIDLPEYEDYETLRKALFTAITTGGEYFGFA